MKLNYENWRKDPDNWKYGLFYFNKDDERIVVEKRNPLFGITFNFAHKQAYYYLIGMFLFFGFVVFAITYLGK